METRKKALYRVICKDMTVKGTKEKKAAKEAGRRISATFTAYEKSGKNMSFEEFAEKIRKTVEEKI